MSSEKTTDLDFEVYREPWNKYSLRDKSSIKGRIILHKVLLKQTLRPDATVEKKSYGIEAQTVTVVYNVPDDMKGDPSTATYGEAELRAAIVQSDIGFDTIAQEWNEYIVEDGTKIRIQLVMMRIDRTSLRDKYGNPTYIIQSGLTTTITPRSP